MREKKSEKLEIRLSYDEKNALTEAAETEGRTVSDLVRGLINRYIKAASTRLPQKKSWLKWAGIGALGLLFGHLATWAFMVQHKNHADVYTMVLSYGHNVITAPILDHSSYENEFKIPAKPWPIKITAQVNDNETGLKNLQLNICELTDTECRVIAAPNLQFHPSDNEFALVKIDLSEPLEFINIQLRRSN